MLQTPEVQQNELKEEVEVIKEESNKEEIEVLSRHVQIHQINSNEVSTEEMLSWMRRRLACSQTFSGNRCSQFLKSGEH